ncbi:glycosyltransferase family 4 protein [Afifella pfennigii]|uniref:glycosyltransferase family 4 protein n=1 Tax=Afifella pfennigii TaxID=209897 RepID=UPI0004799503|nr:glycosyltransferase family 4 protein [Afifella pfennigii]
MKIAFYAPMKPPDHPVPSGDRSFSRAILSALTALGHEVEIVSRLRSWTGAPEEQAGLRRAGLAEADAVVERLRAAPPDFFLTYHLYHKAPDWIGPKVADAFAIPYAAIEASYARRRLEGAWALGAADARKALLKASLVAAIQTEDEAGLREILPAERVTRLTPFTDLSPFSAAPQQRADGGPLKLLAVGMMRQGNKADTYRALATALKAWTLTDWRLTVAGDGPEREGLEALFAPERSDFLGQVPNAAMPGIYAGADIFVWPSVKEPFGFVFMEAMAAGLACIGGRSGGVPDVIREGRTGFLVDAGEPESILAALEALREPALRRRMGEEARQIAITEHSVEAGARALAALLARAVENFERGIGGCGR